MVLGDFKQVQHLKRHACPVGVVVQVFGVLDIRTHMHMYAYVIYTKSV